MSYHQPGELGFEAGTTPVPGVLEGDAGPVVGDTHAAVGHERDLDAAGAPSQDLVHRMACDLEYQAVQTAFTGRADVHPGPLSHGLQPLQHLNVADVVLDGLLAHNVPSHGISRLPRS